MKHGTELVHCYAWRGIRPTFRYRKDPVPSTGSRRYRFCSYYRNPKAAAEKAISSDEMHKPFVRGKRSAANLPNPWDDIPRSSNGDHSWKRQKKRKQWM